MVAGGGGQGFAQGGERARLQRRDQDGAVVERDGELGGRDRGAGGGAVIEEEGGAGGGGASDGSRARDGVEVVALIEGERGGDVAEGQDGGAVGGELDAGERLVEAGGGEVAAVAREGERADGAAVAGEDG